MADKDHDKHEKEAAEKRDARDRQHENRVDNPNQDPNHPANKTLSPERPPTQRSPAEAFNVPPADMMTAQEADQSGGVPGVGPVSPPEISPGPVETIQDQGIGPRTPYPTGSPPPPTETVSRSQGIKGAAEKTTVKPDEVKAPAHKDPTR